MSHEVQKGEGMAVSTGGDDGMCAPFTQLQHTFSLSLIFTSKALKLDVFCSSEEPHISCQHEDRLCNSSLNGALE